MFLFHKNFQTLYGRESNILRQNFAQGGTIIGGQDTEIDDIIEAKKHPKNIEIIATIIPKFVESTARIEYREGGRAEAQNDLYTPPHKYIEHLNIIFKGITNIGASDVSGEISADELNIPESLINVKFPFQRDGFFTNDVSEDALKKASETYGDIDGMNIHIFKSYGGYYTETCSVGDIDNRYFTVFSDGGQSITNILKRLELKRSSIEPPISKRWNHIYVFENITEPPTLSERIASGEIQIPTKEGDGFYTSFNAQKIGHQLKIMMTWQDTGEIE